MLKIDNEQGECAADVVEAARDGDQCAWRQLVDRYQALITSVTRRYRLPAADADDVSQTVWLKLFTHFTDLREPRALPGWLVTTTTHACLDTLALSQRTFAVDPQASQETEELVEFDEGLIRLESRRAVREGMAELTPAQRELLLLVVADPPVSYEQISRRLGVPIGSIGPTRARCLKKLSRTAAVRELANADINAESRAVAAAA